MLLHISHLDNEYTLAWLNYWRVVVSESDLLIVTQLYINAMEIAGFYCQSFTSQGVWYAPDSTLYFVVFFIAS